MCMSCGCGEYNERHKPGDIILDDLRQAAENAQISVEQTASNISESARKLRQEGTVR